MYRSTQANIPVRRTTGSAMHLWLLLHKTLMLPDRTIQPHHSKLIFGHHHIEYGQAVLQIILVNAFGYPCSLLQFFV